MSWHSGDWANFSIAFTSAVAAISAAVAAFKSKKTSDAALELQRKIIKLERRRNLRLSLKDAAKEANIAADGLPPKDWKFDQVSTICTSINAARLEIISECSEFNQAEIDWFKKVFMSYLSTSIAWEVRNIDNQQLIFNDMPYSVMPYAASRSMWEMNREFFSLPDE